MPIDPDLLKDLFKALGGSKPKPAIAPKPVTSVGKAQAAPPPPPGFTLDKPKTAPAPPVQPVTQPMTIGGTPGTYSKATDVFQASPGSAKPTPPVQPAPAPNYTAPQRPPISLPGGEDYVVNLAGAEASGHVPMLQPRAGSQLPTFEQLQSAIMEKPPAKIKDPPLRDLAERRARAAEQGYTTPAFKGMYNTPQRVTDTSKLPEGGVFSAANIELAKQYNSLQIAPLLLNTLDYMVHNAEGKSFSSVNKYVIQEAKKQGKKGVVVLNVLDHPGGAQPSSGRPNLGPQTVYITIDPGTARSTFAKFDPAKKGLNDLLASGVGYLIPPAVAGALFGTDHAEAGEIPPPPPGFTLDSGATNKRTQELPPGFTIDKPISRETAAQTEAKGPVGFFEQLLQDIKGEYTSNIESIKEPFQRSATSNQTKLGTAKELGQDFLSILEGEVGAAFAPLTGAAKTIIGRPLASRETERIREKIGTPYPGYKFPDQLEAEGASAGEIGEAATWLLPGMGLVPANPIGKLFFKPASPLKTFRDMIGDDLHRLRQTATADKEQITQAVKQFPLVGAVQTERRTKGFMNAGATEYLNTVEEITYHLIEDKDVSKLSTKHQNFLADPLNAQAVLEAAKHINPLRLEHSNLYNKLRKLGVPDTDLVDPDYVHRRAVGHTPLIDPSVTGAAAANPVVGYKGIGRSLPTTTTALQERFYQGAEDTSGHRLVISQDDAGNWRVHEAGTKGPVVTTPIDEDHFSYKGSTYRIGPATTREIEAVTPTRYYKNALANTADSLVRMRAVARHVQWFDALKKTPEWQLHATRSAKIGKQKGWTKVDMTQLDGWYVEPKLARAFEDFVRPGIGKGAFIDGMRKLNQFATASIFWNPTPHVENVWGHWLVGRGWDWITPQGARSVLFDGAKAIRAVTTQNADYQRLLKNGSGMIYGGVANADFYRDVSRLAGMQIAREPHKWDIIGRTLGLSLSPVEWTRLLYEGSKRTLWWANDVLMMQRVLELERKGKPLREAISEAEKHIPNYRIPPEVLGSRAFSQLLQEPALTVFSRYHYGVFKSYANMIRDSLGPNRSFKERFDAAGNMLALGILGYVVYPWLDAGLQKLTGDSEARKARRGPIARPQLLYDLYEGKKNWGQFVSDSITLAPATRAGATVLGGGRDPFTGLPITEPGSTAPEQISQGADWALGAIVQPYQLLGKKPEEQGGRSLGRRVTDQVIGAEDTSEAAQRGKRIGAKIERRRAQKRRVHPKGPLERLYGGTDAE